MPFSLSADAIVFSIFLLSNLVLGLFSSRGIKTIREYAVGNRSFSTAVIVSTIVATNIGGHDFFSTVTEVYEHGLNFIWAISICDFVTCAFVAYLLADRMGEFLGKLSVAEAMGDLFGKHVRIITAVCGFIGVAGIIAIQFKVAGKISKYAFDIPEEYGIIIAALIVTIYSSLGGIKAVAFTDVIQFLTFSVTIPLVGYFLLRHTSNIHDITSSVSTSPLYDPVNVFDLSKIDSWKAIFLFLFFGIPSIGPAFFQRISIAKDTSQVRRSFLISGVICSLIQMMLCWIGVIMFVKSPSIVPQDVMDSLLSQTSLVIGLKGLVLAGIMAMVMSTVDSFINSSSVLVVHDFLKAVGVKELKNELLSTRFVAFFIGVLSMCLSIYMKQSSIIEMQINCSIFKPVVTIPLMMAIFGFRSSSKSVLLAMLAGFITMIACRLYEFPLNPVMIAMLANLIVLFLAHYLLRQPGGWVGIKDKEPLLRLKEERRLARQKFFQDLKNFSLMDVLRRNCPKGDGLVSILGFFVMISVFSSFSNLTVDLHQQYAWLLDVIYPMTLFSSALFIGYPLWLQSWKHTCALPIIWNIAMFFVLIGFNFLMVLMSGFAEVQLMVFMVNILLICSLIRWRWALLNILGGTFLITFCYDSFILVGDSPKSDLNIVYLLLLVSSTLVLFLRPKEVKQVLTEEKVEHLEGRIDFQNEEIEKLTDLKYEFLRNLQHEAKTPIAGIVNLSEALWLDYDKMPEKDRKKLVKMIASSGERLRTLIFNFVDLSHLLSLKYDLNIKRCDLGKLLKERLEICSKLYIDESDRDKYEFDVKVGKSIEIDCDSYYMGRVLDNLIINAIKYSESGGFIKINLKSNGGAIEFSIEDQGVGVPESELSKIFALMVVSSRTHTVAGGRGVGLALCKKVIELHDGKIWAESTKSGKGVIFKFTVPMKV